MCKLENPMSPGEVLVELYLKPLNKNVNEFSQILDINRTTISRIIKGPTRISPRTALQLAKEFNTAPNYWMNLQADHEIYKEIQKVDLSNLKPLELVQ